MQEQQPAYEKSEGSEHVRSAMSFGGDEQSEKSEFSFNGGALRNRQKLNLKKEEEQKKSSVTPASEREDDASSIIQFREESEFSQNQPIR